VVRPSPRVSSWSRRWLVLLRRASARAGPPYASPVSAAVSLSATRTRHPPSGDCEGLGAEVVMNVSVFRAKVAIPDQGPGDGRESSSSPRWVSSRAASETTRSGIWRAFPPAQWLAFNDPRSFLYPLDLTPTRSFPKLTTNLDPGAVGAMNIPACYPVSLRTKS